MNDSFPPGSETRRFCSSPAKLDRRRKKRCYRFAVRTSQLVGPLVCALLMLITALASAQRGPATRTEVPALSMTCPMHPDVVEPRPGSCPICKMNLVPVRLDTAWMCPIHTTVMSDKPGTCPLCGRALVQGRVAVTYTCAAQPGIDRLEPGTCPDGTRTVQRRTLRPHGNHNPQHGGQFFMAGDNWHHVEGAYPRPGVFRLYVYDDYARPLSAADLNKVTARVVTSERFDARTRTTTDITAFPLRPSRDRAYLEARLTGVTLPAEMTAKIRLKPDAPEYRFDFTFTAATREPALAIPARRTASGRGSTPAAPSRPAAAKADVAANPSTVPAAGLPPTPIPETIPEILVQLKARDAEVRELIRQGNFAAVWVPAFQAKDLAVALEPHIGRLTPASREIAEPALQRVVRFAWLLDSFGDLGNRQQLEEAYAAFAGAAADVSAAFGGAQ
jgi:heavy metal-binding protein